MRVGVEVGGTFTDLVAVEGSKIVVTKVPSTPRSPDIGAFAALTASGIDLSRIEDLGHGSTVATNAVLERKGAAVAFIATAGFRDLLFMQRHDRRNIYDLFYAKPAPPVRRRDCFEAAERLRADGSVERALDEAQVRSALRIGRERDSKIVARIRRGEPGVPQMIRDHETQAFDAPHGRRGLRTPARAVRGERPLVCARYFARCIGAAQAHGRRAGKRFVQCGGPELDRRQFVREPRRISDERGPAGRGGA